MRYGLVVPLATAAALLALYLNFVEVFVASNLLAGATALELGIFAFQFFKVAAVVSIKRLRDSPVANIIDIAGGELMVFFPGLAIGYLSFGVQSAPSLMVQVLLAWIAGIGTFGTPFATYRLARAMMRGEALITVLPSAVFVSEFMVLLVAGANAAAASGLGLPGISRAMVLVGAGVNTVGAEVAGPTVLSPLVVLYVSLLLYGLAPEYAGPVARLRGLAALALLATAATYAVTYTASSIAVSLDYIAIPSTLVMATLMWWVTREV